MWCRRAKRSFVLLQICGSHMTWTSIQSNLIVLFPTNQLTHDINDSWLHLDLSPLTWNNLMCSLKACRTSAHFPDNRQTLTCYRSCLLHCVCRCVLHGDDAFGSSVHQTNYTSNYSLAFNDSAVVNKNRWQNVTFSEFTDAYKSITAIIQQAKRT